MLAQDHLEKAKRLKETCAKLDPVTDWETIVENGYGMAMHLIAYITANKLKKHMDTHKGLIGFLNENKLLDITALFRELEELRTGRWYGGKTNGDSAKRAMEIVHELEKMAGVA
jgi:hypothetical protein